jgi:RNA-binding protein Musashi
MSLDAYRPGGQQAATQAQHDMAKIFVGGLSWQTTEETLRYHFEQYGPVVSVEVMRDRDTGNPRGFAFVVFKEDSTVELVMSNLPHEINHKIVDVKRAQARGAAPPSIHGGEGGGEGSAGASGARQQQNTGGGDGANEMSPEELHNKIFVGGLPIHLDSEGMKEFFNQYGKVTDAIVMMDLVQNRSRGFGFVTFENGSGGAQKALDSQPIYIDNKYVEIKLATPKGKQNSTTNFSNTGLRNANAAALASTQSKGEFAGFAASFGRNGWKAGYGSYAFGKAGWAVRDWETFFDIPEKSGFSFDLLNVNKGKGQTSSRKRGQGSADPRNSKRMRS